MKLANQILSLSRNLLADENGGEVIEYVLVLGLILIGAILVMSNIGVKVLHRWNSLNSSL